VAGFGHDGSLCTGEDMRRSALLVQVRLSAVERAASRARPGVRAPAADIASKLPIEVAAQAAAVAAVVPVPAVVVPRPATSRTTRARNAPPRKAPALADPLTDERRKTIVRRNLPLLLILGILLVVNLVGLPYYLLPIGSRVRDAFHAWLKPSGYVGQSAGLIAFALFLFLYLYPLRKRFRTLAFLGPLNRWLDVHIVAGIAVPLLGAVHAAWRFHGLIGLGYLSMVLVALSGIVGKYLYVHIPRGRSGLGMTLDEIEARRRELLERIAEATGLGLDEVEAVLAGRKTAAAPLGVGGTLIGLISSDFSRWRMTRRLRRLLRERTSGARKLDQAALRDIVRLARREIALTQQLRMLDATQRLFRYWHVFHRPFSIMAFVAVTIHVVLVVSLGVTWLW